MSTNALADLRIMVNWVHNHFEAGHDLSDPELVTDLGTLLIDLHAVLDALGAPATTDQRVAFLVRQVVALSNQLDEVEDNLEEVIETEAQRVIDTLSENPTGSD